MLIGFSVLMPVYELESPEFLDLALTSIEEQTLPANEIILVEDGPLTSKLYEVVEKFSSRIPISRVRLKSNVGLGKALQIGLDACSFDIVVRVDSDDICLPERFQIQFDYMLSHPSCSAVSCPVEEFREIPGDLEQIKDVPLNEKIDNAIFVRNPLNHMAVAFRKSEVLKAGGYQDLRYMEDYYLWLRMHKNKCQLRNLSEVLVYARVGAGMLARRRGVKYALSELVLLKKIYTEKISTSPIVAIRFFIRSMVRLLPLSILTYVYRILR